MATEESSPELPPIREMPQPQWVRELTGKNLRLYTETRIGNIERDVEGIRSIFDKFPQFAGVPDEILGHVALSLATTMSDGFEEGIQHGIDQEQKRTEARNMQDHLFHLAVQDAVPGR